MDGGVGSAKSALFTTGGRAFALAAGSLIVGVSASRGGLAAGGVAAGALMPGALMPGALMPGALGRVGSGASRGGKPASGTGSKAPPGGPKAGIGVITAERFSKENEPDDDESRAGTAGTPRAGGGTAPGGLSVVVADGAVPSSVSVGSAERPRTGATDAAVSRRTIVAAGCVRRGMPMVPKLLGAKVSRAASLGPGSMALTSRLVPVGIVGLSGGKPPDGGPLVCAGAAACAGAGIGGGVHESTDNVGDFELGLGETFAGAGAAAGAGSAPGGGALDFARTGGGGG